LSGYPEPRRVEISTADVLGLTVLEWARVSVIANVPQQRLGTLARLAIDKNGEPDEIELGVMVLYAIAYQLERRINPLLTWEDAQAWRVVVSTAPEAAALAEAEAEAEVAAAMLSGAPIVRRAGELRIAHVAAYADAREKQRKAARRGGRRRAAGP
jgi:hypothetical protein